MNSPNPPRLKQDPEFGDAVSRVADEELSPERLARNGERVRQRIIALGLAAATLSPTVALWIKIGIGGAVVAAVGTGVYVATNPPSSVEELVESVPSLVSIATNPDTPVPTQVALIPTPVSTPVFVPTTSVVEVTAEPTPVATTVDSSALAEQLADFESARAAANRGEYDDALAQLDALEAAWPATPLKAEIELSRADYLVRGGRLEEATKAIAKLAEDPAHSGRRAQLYQVLGDLWIKLDDCPKAVAAYQQVVAMGGEVDEGVTMGLKKCGNP